jgi:hypothetical protein
MRRGVYDDGRWEKSPGGGGAVLRTKLMQQCFTVAVVLAATALTGCDGGIPMTEAPAPHVSATVRGNALDRSSSVDVDGDGRPELVAKTMAKGDDDQRPTGHDGHQHGTDASGGTRTAEPDGARDQRAAEDEDAEAATPTYAVSPARAREIDLEFSPGLQEPPQDEVLPAPSAWKPAPDAEGSAKPVIDDVWPNKGPASGGERIVIRGRNLQAAQIVFGTTPAHIMEASEDKVTVAAPAAGAGQVAVVVTNRDGNYAVAESAFQYYN